MIPELCLSLLGGFSITIAGQPVKELTSRKAQALLCYLAVTGRTYTRTALAGVFWPDVPEQNARMNLRKELARLRQVVRPYLRIERDSVSLDSMANVWIDVVAFTALVEGLPAAAPATGQPAQATAQQLNEAVALYTGDFLDGFYILHAPPFEEWVLLQRGRLRTGLMQTLQTLAELAMQRDDREQVIAITRQLLAVEPWHEAAHRQLMELLALQGERGAALAQYELCVRLLADELDVEPEPATVALYEQIRDGSVGKLSVPSPDKGPATAPRHNLPTALTPLLGREAELGAVLKFLADPAVRLVTILGPGGMGKTRLALAVAANVKDAYPQGVYLVALAPLSDPESMVSAVALGIGYSFLNDGRSERQEILDYLREKRLLLVLDNAEHLLAGVEFFVEILQTAPEVQLLVTSRERLRLNGEMIFPLSGLSIADERDIEHAAAVQLFLQTAQRVRPLFIPTAHDWSAIAEVCRLVGGMPLGLILAASWIEMLTPTEIAVEMTQGLGFLAADLRDLPERQRSMGAVFATTWQRLSPTEQNAFQQLAIFRGGFTRAAAQAVTGTTLLTLTALSHKSLVQRTPNGRYEIHELLRQFAITRLVEAVEAADAVYDANSAYFCSRLQAWEDDLKGRRQQEALQEIEADRENIRMAWQWAVKKRALERLAPALESWSLYYLWQNRLHEGLAMCQQAVDALFPARVLDRLATAEAHDWQNTSTAADRIRFGSRLLIWLGTFKRHLLDIGSARESIQQASRLLTHTPTADLDLRAEQAQLLLEEAEINTVANMDTNPEQIRALVEQSLTLFRLLDERWYLAQGLALLSMLLQRQGALQQSKQAAEEGLALRRELGDTRGIATSLQPLSKVFQRMGRFDDAETLSRQSIAIFTEVKDQRQLADSIRTLSGIMLHSGQFVESMQQVSESIQLHQRLGLPTTPGFPTISSAFALMHLGRYDEALQQQRQALLNQKQAIDDVEAFVDGPWPAHQERQDYSTVLQTLPDLHRGDLGYMWKDLGRTELALGMDDKAQRHLERALILFHSIDDLNGSGQSLGCLGFLAYKQQAYAQAQAYFQENLAFAKDSHLFLPSLTALCGVALLCAVADDAERAVELYALAQQHRHVANSRWYADVVGRHITAAAATLSPSARAKAEDQGRQRELRATLEALTLPSLPMSQ